MLTSDADLSEPEHVLILKRVHAVTHVMRDLGLQLQDEAAQDLQFSGWQESGPFQLPTLPRDCGERVVDAGKRIICPQLSFNMMPSQVCLQDR